MAEKQAQALPVKIEQKPAITHRPLVQRRCACGGIPGPDGECAECRRKRLARQRQAAAKPDLPTVPSIVHEVLSSPGRPLDSTARAYMEPRFGHEFGHVRIHTDQRAAESAQAIQANAYTVGHDIVFGSDRYQPTTNEGKRLLAHELTHVVQQGSHAAQSSGLTLETSQALEREADNVADQTVQGRSVAVQSSSTGLQMLQRDLVTPPPAVAPAAQPDLTEAQIRTAIAFNKARFNEANTRIIQTILGGPVTGTWTEDNIVAIAATQEEYGLKKDGMVGNDTFRFIVGEQRLEGEDTTTANCLTSFGAFMTQNAAITRVSPTGVLLNASFRTEAQFSDRCNCSQFEYRQFIRGHFRHLRAGVLVRDIGPDFTSLPGGALTAVFQEDGDTTDPIAVNYGHRADPPEAAPENHYINNTGADDQANGCRYRSTDTPGASDAAHPIPNCLPGDVLDVEIRFRGEIQRNGTRIQSHEWSAIQGNFVAPP